MQHYLGCGANDLQFFMVLQSMICFSRSRMLSITVQPYVGQLPGSSPKENGHILNMRGAHIAVAYPELR